MEMKEKNLHLKEYEKHYSITDWMGSGDSVLGEKKSDNSH